MTERSRPARRLLVFRGAWRAGAVTLTALSAFLVAEEVPRWPATGVWEAVACALTLALVLSALSLLVDRVSPGRPGRAVALSLAVATLGVAAGLAQVHYLRSLRASGLAGAHQELATFGDLFPLERPALLGAIVGGALAFGVPFAHDAYARARGRRLGIWTAALVPLGAAALVGLLGVPFALDDPAVVRRSSAQLFQGALGLAGGTLLGSVGVVLGMLLQTGVDFESQLRPEAPEAS